MESVITVIRRQVRQLIRLWLLTRACRELGRLPSGTPLPGHLSQRLARAWGNKEFAASPALLQVVWEQIHQTRGDILECGSGLTTIVLAVATQGTGRTVCTLEHEQAWAERVTRTLRHVRCVHARVHYTPLRSFGTYDWYSVPDRLEAGPFGLVVVDGPPGTTRGGRIGLLPIMRSHLCPGAHLILDDADRPGETEVMADWERSFGICRDRQPHLPANVALLRIPVDDSR
jgi:predicted O-methyltransferase YrrM